MGDMTHGEEQIGTARLVRLLNVIAMPAAPDAMVRRTMAEVAEVLRSAVVCVAERVGDRLRLTEALGVAPEDEGFVMGWPLGPMAEQVIETASPVARERLGQLDAPATLLERIDCSAAWIPLRSEERRV